MWSFKRAASVADRVDFRMRGWIMMITNAVDTAPDYCAISLNDKSGEGNAAFVDMIHGEGHGLLHELVKAF
jgi:hypothetical protein